MKHIYIVFSMLLVLSGCERFPNLGNKYRLDYDAHDSIFGRFQDKAHIYHTNYPSTPQEQDEILSKSTIHRFWIVYFKKGNVYGPYTKEEYLKKREELKVPEILKLVENGHKSTLISWLSIHLTLFFMSILVVVFWFIIKRYRRSKTRTKF